MGQPHDHGADRRTAQRIQIHHHVVFSEYRALGPLRMGTAVDRSSGGLRIITSHPEPLGTTIQIELRASAGSPDVLLLEGRVVHLTPMDKGQCAMGIRLVPPVLRAGAAPVARERRAAAARTRAATRAAGGEMPATGASAVAGVATADEAVTFRRIEDGGRVGSWAALFAILALLVILVLLILEAMRDEGRRASFGFFEGASVEGMLAKIFPEESSANAQASAPSASRRNAEAGPAGLERAMRDEREGWEQRGFLAPVESAVGAPVLSGEISNAALRGGAPPELRRAAGLSAGGFAVMLEYADRAAARGEAGLARAVVRRAMERAGAVPAAWRSLGGKYQAELSGASENGAARLLSREVSLDAAAAAGQGATPLKIEVDTGDHLLRVWRGDEMLAEFPVGLGRDAATPRGEFRVGTKARQPAWYSEGRVVPGGAPENPIGGQWFGLAQDGARTGYGIHPTAQPESIGADESRGCVRMRPEDAETLYRLVPLGAAVTIHS